MKERLSRFRRRMADSLRGLRFRRGSYSLLAAVAVIAAAILLNLLVGALPAQYTKLDTTPNHRFTLSGQTEEILHNLKQEVTLVWVTASGAENADVKQLLDRYAGESRSITVKKLDPVSSPAALRQYAGDAAETLEDNSIIVVSGGVTKILNYRYDIYTYSDYSTYYEMYYYYGTEYLDDFVAERSITSAIRYVTTEKLPVVYVLTGHGEQDISALYSEMELENLRVESLDLRTQAAVPQDCAALVIASPTRDLSEQECAAVADYVAAGGRLLLLTNYVERETMPNLLALMENYGLTLVEGTVFERDGDHYVYYPFYLYPSLLSHEITEPLIQAGYRVVMPDGQGLLVAEEPPAGVSAQALLTTSDKAYSHVFTENEDADEYGYQPAEEDAAGPFALAAAATVEAGEAEARVVWISSIFLLDSMINEMSAGGNMDLFLNTLDWMSEGEESLGIRSITVSSDYLTMSAASVTAFTVVLILLIPAVFVVDGVITVTRRRRRQ